MEKTVDDVEKTFFERQLVVFNIGQEEFGIDISDVKEIIKWEQITKLPDVESYIKGIINIRGEIVAIVDLAEKINLTGKEEKSDTRIIVTEVHGKGVGFLVDGCNDVLRITGDKIQKTPSVVSRRIKDEYLKGVAVLDDRLIVLIDLGTVIHANELGDIEESVSGADTSTSNGDKKKLLIVEDSSIMRGTLKSYIDPGKYTISEAEDENTALGLIDSIKPEIVFLDIKLGSANGVDILRKIRTKLPDTKVVMETSVYEDKVKEECLTLGAFEYLKKPVNKNDIVTVLEKINSAPPPEAADTDEPSEEVPAEETKDTPKAK